MIVTECSLGVNPAIMVRLACGKGTRIAFFFDALIDSGAINNIFNCFLLYFGRGYNIGSVIPQWRSLLLIVSLMFARNRLTSFLSTEQ
jgi:hypothetical protein